jgi:hypothetical protein
MSLRTPETRLVVLRDRVAGHPAVSDIQRKSANNEHFDVFSVFAVLHVVGCRWPELATARSASAECRVLCCAALSVITLMTNHHGTFTSPLTAQAR